MIATFKEPVRRNIQPQVALYRKYIGHNIIGLWPRVKIMEVINMAVQAGIFFANEDCKYPLKTISSIIGATRGASSKKPDISRVPPFVWTKLNTLDPPPTIPS